MHSLNIVTRPNSTDAVRWSAAQGIFAVVIQFATLAILSRLLEPAIFGVMSIVLVIHNISNLFAQMGLSSAIVQRKELTSTAADSIFWLNILLGAVVTVMLILLSPLITRIFKFPELLGALITIAATFAVASWGVQYQALAQRQLRFKRMALINTFSILVSGVISVALALNGYGVWSLVGGIVGATITRTLLFILLGIRDHGLPSLTFNWNESRELTQFGAHRFGAMLSNALITNSDQLLVGGLFGAQALGYYNVATRIVMQPIDRINPIVTRVAFPWLSRIQHDDVQTTNTYLKILDSLAAVNAPILIGCAVLAPYFIPLLLGEQWQPVIQLVQILSIYALIRTNINAGASLILAKGRADWTFYWNLALLFIFPATLVVAAQFGDLTTLAYTLLGLQATILVFYHRFLIYPLISLPLQKFLTTIGKPILCAAISGAITFGVLSAISWSNAWANLIGGGLIGIVTYLPILWLISPNSLKNVKQVMQRKPKGKSTQ